MPLSLETREDIGEHHVLRAVQIGLIAGGANRALAWIHLLCSARRAETRVGKQHIQRDALIASGLPIAVFANETAYAVFAEMFLPVVHANGTAFAVFAEMLLPVVLAIGTAFAIFALGLPPFVVAIGTAFAIFALFLPLLVFAAPPAVFHPHAACKLGILITNLVRNFGFLNLNRSHSLSDHHHFGCSRFG